MNTYDENLRESLTRSLGVLADQQTDLLHGQAQAEAGLYHAKGAVLAARDRLELDQRRREERRAVHHAAQRAHDHATALCGTLSLAKQGADGAITGTAAAARDLQTSADAIMQLAATVGSALNVASAALYGTELYHQIARVNGLLNRVANQARFQALKGTEASSRCAESIIGALADQGTDVQTRLQDLMAQAQTALDDRSQAVDADEADLNTARAEEFTARHQLREAKARADAMTAMLAGARRYANMDLQVEVLSARKVKVRCAGFQPPVAHGDRPQPPAHDARIVVTFLPQAHADQFTAERAAQLFSKWDGQPGIFTAVTPGETTVTLKRDAQGGAITAGTAYVAFLMVEPGVEYKRHLGSFSDYLSAASAPFTPVTRLPAPVYAGRGGDSGSLILAVPDEGQAGGATGPMLAELEAGAKELDRLVTWLRENGARLEPELAEGLDAVAPPFAGVLSGAIAAAKEGRPDPAAAGAGRDLLKALKGVAEPAEPVAEVTTLLALLQELARLVEKTGTPAGDARNAPQRLDLRCLMVDHALDDALTDPARKGTLPGYLTVDVARKVAPANVVHASRLDAAPEGVKLPSALKGKPCLWYEVAAGPQGKDCFGNPLLPGHRYTPVVLATAGGPDAGEWQDSLTLLDHTWQLAVPAPA